MELEKLKIKVRCEFGLCKEFATASIILSRAGLKARLKQSLSICEGCLKALKRIMEDYERKVEKCAEAIELKTVKKEEAIAAEKEA